MKTKPFTLDFIRNFLFQTEKNWANKEIDQNVYGFQFQAGTRWNPGLSRKSIDKYQSELGIQFPADLIAFLQEANGTNPQTVNVYGNSGEPHVFGPGVYSFPEDLEVVKQRIEWLNEDFAAALESLGLGPDILGGDPKFVPFFGHRFVLCNGDPATSIVCSIVGSDAIIYGASLRDYLIAEFI